MTIRQLAVPVLFFMLVVSGCGGGELSLTDYTERVNTIELHASAQGGELAADAGEIEDFTPQDLQAMLEQARVIRVEVDEAANDLVPPGQIVDVHELVFDWHAEFIATEEALAARAGATPHTPAGWKDLSESPEMGAYRSAIADGKRVCSEFQERLDATEARGAFADTPWIPSEMKEVVERVLGCDWFPDNPNDVYRYPPTTSTP